MTQGDLRKILQKPTEQVVRCLDNIMQETVYTKKIINLRMDPELQLITFRNPRVVIEEQEAKKEYKVTSKIGTTIAQAIVDEELKENRIIEDDKMITSVTVNRMNIKWLNRCGNNFLDLVDTLDGVSN